MKNNRLLSRDYSSGKLRYVDAHYYDLYTIVPQPGDYRLYPTIVTDRHTRVQLIYPGLASFYGEKACK